MKSQQKHILWIAVLLLLFAVTIGYGFDKFVWKENKIETVELHMNKSYDQVSPIVYVLDDSEVSFNFSRPHYASVSHDSIISFDLSKVQNIRKVRIYFERTTENLTIQKVIYRSGTAQTDVDLQGLIPGNGVQVLESEEHLKVNVTQSKGFLETPKHYFYRADKNGVIVIIGVVLAILVGLFFSFKNLILSQHIKRPTLADAGVVMFICSIFLPHPIFNITLILSVLLVIKKFNFKQFFSEKLNLVFVVCFFVLFLNDLFIADSGIQNLKSSETYLPLLILPIYISCVKTAKSLVYFPVSAILLGVVMLLTSVVDAVVFKNISYFSFDQFAKFTHPVYFSYLSSFSIFFIVLHANLNKFYKSFLQGILFFFLILAGSKLVLTLTFLIYAGLVIKNKKAAIIMAVGLALLALFPPVQKRFKKILNPDDLSIISEEVITDNNDPRVNGLTLRLLLWQESINAIETVPEFIFGKGVGKATDDILKTNLVKRGLGKYQRFSTHNQFVNIFMRAGLLGVVSLLMIIVFGLIEAIKKKNRMLLIMLIMFTFAMLTESVFQRVLGIYFFTTVLLFLAKTNFLITFEGTDKLKNT